MIAADDFIHLANMWRAGRKVDVVAKLKEWEKAPKDDVAAILHEVWIKRIFPSSSYQKFESAVKKVFEGEGYEVRRAQVVDFMAEKGVCLAVECKNDYGGGKIYEGIGQLLFYKWDSKDDKSLLILAVPKQPSDKLVAFAKSLGVSIRVVEFQNPIKKEKRELIKRLYIEKRFTANKIAEMLGVSERYVWHIMQGWKNGGN